MDLTTKTRWLFVPLILCVLAAQTGCDRPDARIQKSLDALKWGGGSAEDRRIRDLLVAALNRTTNATLTKPELISTKAALRQPPNGLLRLDWIGATPAADAVRVLLSSGDVLDLAFDPIDIGYNDEISKGLLIYGATLFVEKTKPAMWKKIVADRASKAVLLKNSKVVSNEIQITFWTPPPKPPATTGPDEDLGKMIGTIDPKGQASIFMLSQDVKAGETFRPGDAGQVGFQGTNTIGIKTEDLLDLGGPSAYAGRVFRKDYKSGELLRSGMFAPAAAMPATAK